jgi:hypothetical protein
MRHLFALVLAAVAAGGPVQYFAEDWDAGSRGDFPAAAAAREAFLGRLADVAVEDFEGRHGRTLEVPLGGYGARISGGARDSVSSVARLSPGRRATSGTRFYEHGSDALVLELEQPVEAVGFYAIDAGDAGGRLRVTLVEDDGSEHAFPVPHHVVPRGEGEGEGAVLFFGVVVPGARIRRVELRNEGDPGDGFGYDDLVVGRVRRPVL